MSGIITQGYGAHNLIITRGYGLWERIVEVAKEIVRWVPVDWRHVEVEIPVIGDLVFPEEKELKVLGDLILKMQKTIGIKGKLDQTELMMWLLSDEDEELLSKDLTDREKMLAMKKKLLKELKKEPQKKEKVQAATSIAKKIQEIASLMDQLEKAKRKKDPKKIGEIANRLEEIVEEKKDDIQTKEEAEEKD